MIELIEANWPLFVIALMIGILVAWWIFVAMRRTRVETDTSDVLDEGKGPANRNQALIDAPPASKVPVVASPAMGVAGTDVTVATAAEKVTEPASNNPSTADADDLSRIKGVGPKLKNLLISLGVTRFDEIANWTEREIDEIDSKLGRFEGRIRRDNWMEQARLLAADDTAGYEDKFGKL